MVKNIIGWFRGALLLDDATFKDFKDSGDVFARGISFFLAITLIVALVSSGVQLVTNLITPFGIQADTLQSQMDQMFRSFPGTTSEQYGAQTMIMAWMDIWLEAAERIWQLPTLIPRPAESVFRAAGTLVTVPLQRIGGWMFYAMIVFVIAKLLGGKATLQQMLGMTSLYIAPHILGVLSPIPCIRTIVWIIGTAWGAVIYVKATAVANEMSNGRAALAVFFPILVLLFLIMLLITISILATIPWQ